MGDRENTDPRNHEPQQNARAPLPAVVAPTAPNPEQPHGENVHNGSETNPEPSEKWFKTPDWWMVILTAFILVATIITAKIFHNQFKEMRNQTGLLNDGAKQAAADSVEAVKRVEKQLTIAKQESDAARDSVKAIQRQSRQDQRAWLEIVPQGTTNISIGKPVGYTFQIVNKGKTPATDLVFEMVVKLIDNIPRKTFVFRYTGEPRLIGTTGILNPQEPVTREAGSLEIVPGSTNGQTNPHAVTKEEFQRLVNGDYFVIAYVRIRYRDIFGISHWSKFCEYSGVNPSRSYYAQWCTNYSSVDNN